MPYTKTIAHWFVWGIAFTRSVKRCLFNGVMPVVLICAINRHGMKRTLCGNLQIPVGGPGLPLKGDDDIFRCRRPENIISGMRALPSNVQPLPAWRKGLPYLVHTFTTGALISLT